MPENSGKLSKYSEGEQLYSKEYSQPKIKILSCDRYILEGVVVLHETIHELKRKKQNGILLKLDFEKAYDKVSWVFLQQTLRMKGFDPQWCKWINKIVTGAVLGSRSMIRWAASSKQRKV